jgi:hypothetical protein
MKNFKQARNLWILAGGAWLLAFVLKLAHDRSVLSLILNGIVCVFSFVNAYINHKKISKDDKS